MILQVVGCELSAHSSAGGAERSGTAKLAGRGEVLEKSEAVIGDCDYDDCEQWTVITVAVISLLHNFVSLSYFQ